MITDSQNIQSSPIDTCPEIKLLLCCARTQPSPEISQQIQTLVQQTLDWSYLLQIATRHSVLPLLYQNLKTLCPEAVPKPVLSELRNFFHTNATHNLFLTQELLQILKLFQDNDIPAIPFKGPVLAASVYGNLALRQFGDLDIWVREEDFLRVITDITAKKYETPFRQGWMGQLPLYKLININYNVHECAVVHVDNRVHIDVHKSLTRKSFFLFQLDFEYLWQRIELVDILGTEVSSLHPEDLLLVLCVHGSKHHWHKLGWICDIAELVRVNQEMAWEDLLKQAKKLGCERMLLIGLTLANNLLGTPLPEIVHQSIEADPKSILLVEQVYKKLFHDSFIFDASSKFSYCFRMMERPQDKLRYSVGFIINKSLIRLLWFIKDSIKSKSPIGKD
ncbi:MAG: nucleotidyltransferase family protein [Snowella sp.]|nr:nucleotidyltransferase family protein [Snowella sp.]